MKRPRPVLTASSVSGLITGIALVAAFLGYAQVSKDLSGAAQTIGSTVALILPIVTHATAGVVAQRAVTPMSDPRDKNGNALVPEYLIHASLHDADAYYNTDNSDLVPGSTVAASGVHYGGGAIVARTESDHPNNEMGTARPQ